MLKFVNEKTDSISWDRRIQTGSYILTWILVFSKGCRPCNYDPDMFYLYKWIITVFSRTKVKKYMV